MSQNLVYNEPKAHYKRDSGSGACSRDFRYAVNRFRLLDMIKKTFAHISKIRSNLVYRVLMKMGLFEVNE
jgi:hypothetical protein